MQLKLTRSQRDGGLVSTKVIFCLDARIQLTAEEQASVTRYRLGNQVIYNSEASKRHLARTNAALAEDTFGGTIRAFGSLALVALNLNITINGLQRGQHIECKDLDELGAAEEAIMQACQRLREYLDKAATFDGRETLIEFKGAEPVFLSSPAPPMLTVAVAAPQGWDAPEINAPSPVSFKSAHEEGQEPQQADAIEYRNALTSTPSGPDQLAEWFGRFVERASPEGTVLIGLVCIVILALLLKACA